MRPSQPPNPPRVRQTSDSSLLKTTKTTLSRIPIFSNAMYSALTLVFLLGSASAETGYNRNATKLAANKPGVDPLIVGGAAGHD